MRREERRHRRARPDNMVQRRAMAAAGREIARPVRHHVMAHDAEAAHLVPQTIEAGRFELTQSIRDDAAPRLKRAGESAEVQMEAVGQQMSRAERSRIGNHLIEVEPDGRIVRRNNGLRAQHDAEPNVVTDHVHRQFQSPGVFPLSRTTGSSLWRDRPRPRSLHVAHTPWLNRGKIVPSP